MAAAFKFDIYIGESRPLTVSYVCEPLTGTTVGTATVTMTDSSGRVVSGYNAVNVDAQDTGPATQISMRKQIDCTSGIAIGTYEIEFKPTINLSDGSTDEPKIIGVVNVLRDTI